MNKFQIKQLVAAFGYEEIILARNLGQRHFVEAQQISRHFLKELEEHLINLAAWKMGDNKVCFIWEGEYDGLFHAIQFWDNEATYMKWGKLWGKGGQTPENFIKGKEKVQKAIRKYLLPSVSSLEANLF